MNKVIISGNLTKDPEVRYTASQKAVANFAIGNNDIKDKTEFINCVAWDKLAEIISDNLNKGDKVVVEGRLQTRSWDSDKGKRYQTEVVVSSIESSKRKS